MDPVTLEGRHSSNKAARCLVGDYTVQECETDKKTTVHLQKIPLQLLCIRGFTPIKVCYLLCGELGDTARHGEASTEDAFHFMQEDTQ